MSARFNYDLLGPLKARGRSWEVSGRKKNLDELNDDGDVHPCVFLLCAADNLATEAIEDDEARGGGALVERPHQGQLYYEQRGFLAYETLAKAIQDLSLGKPR